MRGPQSGQRLEFPTILMISHCQLILKLSRWSERVCSALVSAAPHRTASGQKTQVFCPPEDGKISIVPPVSGAQPKRNPFSGRSAIYFQDVFRLEQDNKTSAIHNRINVIRPRHLYFPCFPKCTHPVARGKWTHFDAHVTRRGGSVKGTSKGPLAKSIERYLAHKRSLGKQLTKVGAMLQLLDGYLHSRGVMNERQIAAADLEAFIASRSRPSPRSYNGLVGGIRGLMDWMVVHEILPESPLQCEGRRLTPPAKPFLFSPV